MLRKSKHQITCSITNSGKGISKGGISRIFDRFYRADPSRNNESGGHGLGLTIAKAIMDRLGGSIHVTSVENEDTTFSFTL
jgi:signal transduction histidine kinase